MAREPIDIALQGAGSHGAVTPAALARRPGLDDRATAGISGTGAAVPRTPGETESRLDAVSFRPCRVKGLRPTGRPGEGIRHDGLDPAAHRDAGLHRIRASDTMCRRAVSGRMNAETACLGHPFAIRRQTAGARLQTASPQVGTATAWRPGEAFRPPRLGDGRQRGERR